jgi:hypothetical protein
MHGTMAHGMDTETLSSAEAAMTNFSKGLFFCWFSKRLNLNKHLSLLYKLTKSFAVDNINFAACGGGRWKTLNRNLCRI